MFPKAPSLGLVLCLPLLRLAATQSLLLPEIWVHGAASTTPPSSLVATNGPSSSSTLDSGAPRPSTALSSSLLASAVATGSLVSSFISASHASSLTIPTTPAATAIVTDGTLKNGTLKNSTVPAGQLPIEPALTPGWGVAGAILLTTGLFYTLVGIRNRYVHTFFSTAYLTALGVTVLIVYVMQPPVNERLQGGYVAATILSGCALGALSIFFKEMTEGLGCVLGGFCVSMWLLCLVPGGLLQTVASVSIFITCFTLAAFAPYFSRYTRDWALISMMSFSGATATVLGIDCYSKAGLKEFWAYVWHLNGNLLPLGVDTFPVTKGIRVETAAIVIISLFGIISQIKLWNIVRMQHERRAAIRRAEQQNLDEEELVRGRQVKADTARDRRQWEMVYGDGQASVLSGDSGFNDVTGEKGFAQSHAESSKLSASDEVIEMADITEAPHVSEEQFQPRAGPLMATGHDDEGTVTVRVVEEDVPEHPCENEEPMHGEAGEALNGPSTVGKAEIEQCRPLVGREVTGAPEVVPLPFAVREGQISKSPSERSSVATFADEEEVQSPGGDAHRSSTNQIPRRSLGVLRPSQPSRNSSRTTAQEPGGDLDALIAPKHADDVDTGSVAATMDDDDTMSGSSRRNSSQRSSTTMELRAELAEKTPAYPLRDGNHDSRPLHHSKSVVSVSKETGDGVEAADDANGRTVVKTVAESQHGIASDTRSRADDYEDVTVPPSENLKSVCSVTSRRVSLTKDRLPPSMSRVAMSYRTNEWAKHLSKADMPHPDDLRIQGPSVSAYKEAAAPVDPLDLQRTASTVIQGHPVQRLHPRASVLSDLQPAPNQRLTISSSMPLKAAEGQQVLAGRSTDADLSRSASSGNVFRRVKSGFQPIFEEHSGLDHDAATSCAGNKSPSLAGTPQLDSIEQFKQAWPPTMSYANPNTLMGQRDMFLRSKSQGNLLYPAPELSGAFQEAPSETSSIYDYPAYGGGLFADADDIPLSQRKLAMRRSSAMALNQAAAMTASSSNPNLIHRSSSRYEVYNTDQGLAYPLTQRSSLSIRPPAVREAQLASFRQSVALDLRAGSPIIPTTGRDTPFQSTPSLLSGRDRDVSYAIDVKRNMLMSQKDAEAQRREAQHQQKEYNDRAFDEGMRAGVFLEAHKEAMRKLQQGTKSGH